MQPDPNPKMDQLLKACAEKRRQESGPPREMPAVTREMFQSEVIRVFAKPPTAARSWFRLSWSFWPQLAAAGTLVALFALSGLLFLHSRIPPDLPMEPARRGAKKPEAAAAAVQAPAARSGVASEDKRTADEAIAKPSATPAPMILAKKAEVHFEEKESLEFKDSLSTAVAKDKLRARAMEDAGASAAPQAAVAERAANTEGGVPSTPAPAPPPVAAQPTSPLSLPVESRREIAGALQQAPGGAPAEPAAPSALVRTARFAQTDPRSLGESAKKPAAKFQILAAFQVEERGNEIRIVDSDGSVYVGEMDRTAMTAKEFPALDSTSSKASSSPRDTKATERSRMEYDKGTVGRSVARGRDEEPGFSFRAKGDCRSLNLRVEIRGRLIAERALPQAQAGAAKTPSKMGAAAFKRQPSSGTRIHAEASLESGEKLELDAWEVGP